MARPAAQDLAREPQGGIQGNHAVNKMRDNRIGRIGPTSLQRERASSAPAFAGTRSARPRCSRRRASRWRRPTRRPGRRGAGVHRGQPRPLGTDAERGDCTRGSCGGPDGSRRRGAVPQRFGGLHAGVDGLLAVGVRDGAVYYVSSSLARSSAAPAGATQCRRRPPDRDQDSGRADANVMKTELVAVPTATGARAAYLVTLGADVNGVNGSPVAFATYVDATDRSCSARIWSTTTSDNPEWAVFPNTPPLDYSSTDTRVRWCASATAGCNEVVGSAASPLSWDQDSATGPTLTTTGNNSRSPSITGTATTRSPWAPSWPRSARPGLQLCLDQPVAPAAL